MAKVKSSYSGELAFYVILMLVTKSFTRVTIVGKDLNLIEMNSDAGVQHIIKTCLAGDVFYSVTHDCLEDSRNIRM